MRIFGMMRAARLIAGLTLAVALAVGTACERVRPVRTLPSWVRGIYVPMVVNKSYEPGLEEEATRLIQEAFLFDGRLDIVPKDQADLILVADIVDWREQASGSTGDKVTTDHEVEVKVNLSLFEPFNRDTPIAVLPQVAFSRDTKNAIRFNTDVRSVDYEPEPDRKQEVLERLARTIVETTITGFPHEIGTTPINTALPTVAPATRTALEADRGSSVGAQ